MGGEAPTHSLVKSGLEAYMHAAFQVHMLTEAGKQKAKEIAQAFDECLTRLEAIVPSGREMALVRTKLEEARFPL